MTNKERLIANNEKIQAIQETLKNKILASLGDGEYFVKVIDYDGTILKEARLDTGDTFTLPSAPSHDGLVFQEWSCSQEIVDGVITIEDNNVMVGAVYTTASGLNEFDIEITKAMEADIATNGFVVTLNMDGTKDWGDGTSDDLTTHTYTNYGKYTIKCDGTTMTTSSSSGLFGQTGSNINYYCVSAKLATLTDIKSYAFQLCYSLKNVTISNTLTKLNAYSFSDMASLTSLIIPNNPVTFANYVFKSCHTLTTLVVPYGVTNMGSYVFQGCYALLTLAIPKSITDIKMSTFSSCRALKNLLIPDSVSTMGNDIFNGCTSLSNITWRGSAELIGSGMFNVCYPLKSIKIPNKITLISTSAFAECYSLTTYDFSEVEVVPTLSNINAFDGINATAKIIVPDALYDEWIVATNWSTYADYIYKASEVQ